MLEDAAFELFLENGYAGTTVDQIAQRAGVSRNTFFNYFAAKSDVFWADMDAALDALPEHLSQRGSLTPIAAILDSLVATCGDFDGDDVPWLLTQYEFIGPSTEVAASALARLGRLAGLITTFMAVRLGEDPSSMSCRWIGYASASAVVAAAQEWADRGESRGVLAPYLTRSFRPLLRGFAE